MIVLAIRISIRQEIISPTTAQEFASHFGAAIEVWEAALTIDQVREFDPFLGKSEKVRAAAQRIH